MFLKSIVSFFTENFRVLFVLGMTFLAWLSGYYLYSAAVVLAIALPIDLRFTSDKVSQKGNRMHYATLILYLLPLWLMWRADWIIPLAVFDFSILIGAAIDYVSGKLARGIDRATTTAWRSPAQRSLKPYPLAVVSRTKHKA
jgi:hypothetical protein